MMRTSRFLNYFWAGLMLGGASDPLLAQSTSPLTRADASVAAVKNDDGKFLKVHQAILKRINEGPIGLLFLGDSITHDWKKAPEIWDKYYSNYQPANFGVGGDRTENLLWRIENGELEGIHPKVVVLMIGTNNSAVNTAADVGDACAKIVEEIRAKLPETKILLVGLLPRGTHGTSAEEADAARRMKFIAGVNERLAGMDDGKQVRYLDIGAKFVDANGEVPEELMPDHLHPSPAGYAIWAEAMNPLLTEMIK